MGSITGDQTAGSIPGFGEVGLNLLDLRHLGVDRTLVLVDGRRHVSGLAGSAAVDIDAIPTDLLRVGGRADRRGVRDLRRRRRVGCRQFQLKKDFEGLSFAARAAISAKAMATTISSR